MVKVTFTLDEETVRRLREAAERLRKPQSMVLREAVAEYAAAARRLSEAERRTKLDALDCLVERASSRAARDVDAEIRAIRRTRRTGARRAQHPRS